MLAWLELALFLWALLIQDHASLPSTIPAVQRAYHMLFTNMSAKCVCTSYSLEWLRMLTASAMYPTRDLTHQPPMQIAIFYHHHAAHLPDRPQPGKIKMRHDKRSWV